MFLAALSLTFKIKVLQIRFTYLTLWSNHFTKLGHEWFIDCGLLCDEIASISLFVYSLRRTLYLSKVNRHSHNKEKVKSWILEDFINSIFFLEKISSKKLFRFVLFSFFFSLFTLKFGVRSGQQVVFLKTCPPRRPKAVTRHAPR